MSGSGNVHFLLGNVTFNHRGVFCLHGPNKTTPQQPCDVGTASVPIIQSEKQKATQLTIGRDRIQTQVLLAPKPTYRVLQLPTPQSLACFAALLLTSSQLVD